MMYILKGFNDYTEHRSSLFCKDYNKMFIKHDYKK